MLSRSAANTSSTKHGVLKLDRFAELLLELSAQMREIEEKHRESHIDCIAATSS